VVVVTLAAARQAPAESPFEGAWALPSLAGFAVNDVLSKPIQKDALLAALQRTQAEAQAPGKVLVVNHDSGALQTMADTLQQLGYHAVCRDSGARALQELDALRPQAIILDLLMPDLDGVAFLGQLRQLPHGRHTPVFLWADTELGAAQYARLAASAQAALHHGQGGMDTLLQDLDAMHHARRPTAGSPHGPDIRPDH
jgi:CheY-like chemotaxis protein